MKSYKKPEIELIDVQISQFCDMVNPSSVGVENPSESGGSTGGNIGQVESKDDL